MLRTGLACTTHFLIISTINIKGFITHAIFSLNTLNQFHRHTLKLKHKYPFFYLLCTFLIKIIKSACSSIATSSNLEMAVHSDLLSLSLPISHSASFVLLTKVIGHQGKDGGKALPVADLTHSPIA
jgi:hypothetical protein